jgi:hypothetical protein
MFKKENPSFTVRFANSTLFTDFGLIDDRQIIFSTEIITGLAGSQMLSTNNAQLIKVIKDYFEYRWNTAMIEYPRKGD